VARQFLVERAQAIDYAVAVPETLEQRIGELEKRVAELAAAVGARPRQKDWLNTVGTWADDEISREAERLGREYRDTLGDSADSVGT